MDIGILKKVSGGRIMALIQVNFVSRTLMRTVPIHVVLPVDKFSFSGVSEIKEKSFKTLYLLHGVFGNYTDWVSGTRIQRWAEEKDLAVIMPSGDNAFYVDQPAANNYYGEFIGKELVEITRNMFHLSRRKEDTFIAGLSMGGFGAIRNGLKYHNTFGYIAAFSAGLVLEDGLNKDYDDPFILNNRAYFESCFGDLEKAINSDKNPKYLVKKLIEQNIEFPDIYMACGIEDHLLTANRDFKDFLEGKNIPVTYEEGPGGHDWDFWDKYISKALDWLPLEDEKDGINSGNITI